MKQNIALIIEQEFDPLAGGVQQSTSKLARLFRQKGNGVVIISIGGVEKKSLQWESIPVFYTGSDHSGELARLLVEFKVIIALNQSGFNLRLTRILRKVLPSGTCLINTLRFNPLAFIDNHEVTIRRYFENKKLGFLYNHITGRIILEYHLYRQKFWYIELLKEVDALILLSPGYRREVFRLSPGSRKFEQKLYDIPNLFPISDFQIPAEGKQKVILYVGRLNITEKRVDILMHVWKKLHSELPGWEFWVVGYGPEEAYMKDFCRDHDLGRVRFFGKDKPDSYYEKAAILHFTSASEGFPNVLVESQRYGCVPVLFNSYIAARDIVEDGFNGFLINPFNETRFIEKTFELVNDPEKTRIMGENCIVSSHRFSLENVYLLWEKLFQHLKIARNSK
jgi:glycosyltransferase involved in cell wall biosynthesis